MQAVNPYEILGIKNTANLDEIVSAFRRKVKKLHPDTNPKSQFNSSEFNYLFKAYNFLKNNNNRKLYDDGKIDFCGIYNRYKKRENNKEENLEDCYINKINKNKKFFNRKFVENYIKSFLNNKKILITKKIMKNTGKNSIISSKLISIPFELSVSGGYKEVKLNDENFLKIKIPAGIKSGQIIRLKQKGEISLDGSKKDLLIKIRVDRHKLLKRDGDNIILDLPISINEAIIGGKIRVPTIDGPKEIIIPKGSNTGKILRLKGLGIQKENNKLSGDQLIKLFISFPKKIDKELEDFALNWSKKNYNPRNAL
ncbi:MAG: Curved DNA-binding protein [Alphaproteobacteria bacterium MarineAlpha2_Bin1]|nr:MAG: Curved DNA-binding protein [Alphaproteobacteria bacterium MarineAlpha2_Bin1]